MAYPPISQTLHLSGQAWVWVAGLLALVLALIHAARILRRYIKIMVNLMDDHAPMPENGGNGVANASGQVVSFRAADGHPLEGVIISADAGQATKGMVVFAHEVGSDRSSCPRYCRGLSRAGYDVFAFDFRGHGASADEDGYRPRQWASDRERADMLGAIAFIASRLEQQGRATGVGLFGVSRGGGAAILSAVGNDAVRAVVTDGGFSSDWTLEFLMKRFATTFVRHRVVARNHPPMVWRFLRWLLFRECRRKFQCRFPSVRKAMSRLGRRPILMIHAGRDSYIPVAHSQELYALARGPKALWIVPEAKHNQCVIVAPDAYATRLVGFFDEHLAARPWRVPLPTGPNRVGPGQATSSRAPHKRLPTGTAMEPATAE